MTLPDWPNTLPDWCTACECGRMVQIDLPGKTSRVIEGAVDFAGDGIKLHLGNLCPTCGCPANNKVNEDHWFYLFITEASEQIVDLL